ncbi:MAG: adenylate/guanylate cyclase domain-containing protein [Gemmatimonadetes bacterium]|nr:adenylate/guanylate cyclase domain-containing protein [Gemmatimonadota bacterium]
MQDGSIVEMSVLFADLTGFTSMTQRLGAERTYEIVDAFFRMANAELLRNDAFIDKYIGDAVMALFNVPIRNPNHARSAVSAALGIQAGMKQLSEAMGDELKARVGVATGYARVGRLGSTERKDYTAIGDVVNLAARLESAARPGEVLVDERAFAQVASDYPSLTPEVLNVKGLAEPVSAFRLGATTQEASAAPAAATEPVRTNERNGIGAALFTILGAPCALSATVSPIAILLGLGSLGSALGAGADKLDAAEFRVPMQVFAVGGALANLYVLRRTRRRHAGMGAEAPTEAGSHHAGLTGEVSSRMRLVHRLSVLALIAVAIELVIHSVVLGKPYLEPRW